jgi:hypothetical protein
MSKPSIIIEVTPASCRTMLQLAWLGYISCALQGPGMTYDANSVDKMTDAECISFIQEIMYGECYLSSSYILGEDGMYGICLIS